MKFAKLTGPAGNPIYVNPSVTVEPVVHSEFIAPEANTRILIGGMVHYVTEHHQVVVDLLEAISNA